MRTIHTLAVLEQRQEHPEQQQWTQALGQGQALLSAVTLHWNGHVRQFPHLDTLSTSTNMVHVFPYVACSCGLHRFDLQELRLQPSGCFLLGNRACR